MIKSSALITGLIIFHNLDQPYGMDQLRYTPTYFLLMTVFPIPTLKSVGCIAAPKRSLLTKIEAVMGKAIVLTDEVIPEDEVDEDDS